MTRSGFAAQETILDVASERIIWKVSAVIEATEAAKDEAAEAIARALCPDEYHHGECPVPWTLMASRFEDLSRREQASWRESFDLERAARPESQRRDFRRWSWRRLTRASRTR